MLSVTRQHKNNVRTFNYFGRIVILGQLFLEGIRDDI
jgi:hypothetical protein